MRASIHNRFSRRDPRRWACALGLAATGLSTLSVSAVPAIEWLENRARIDELSGRDAGGLDPAARGYDPLVRARALSELVRAAVALVPAEVDLVEVFSQLRLAAQASRVRLLSIQPSGSEPTGMALGELHLQRVLLTLGGECELARLPEFLARVRAAGHPLTVESFSAACPERGAARFQFQLDLGLLQRVEPPEDDAEDETEYEE